MNEPYGTNHNGVPILISWDAESLFTEFQVGFKSGLMTYYRPYMDFDQAVTTGQGLVEKYASFT